MTVILCGLILMFFFSCASAPKVAAPGDAEIPELYTLPEGGRAYIWVDTVEARPLLDVLSFAGFSGKDMAQLLDSTESAVAVVYPEGHDRKFFLAARGKFPVFRANFSMTFSKDWKREKSSSGGRYWYSKNDGIALALESSLALVSNIDPYAGFASEAPPTGFAEFRRGYALAGWMPNPSETVNDVISSMGVPLQIPAEDFFFGASRLSPAAGEGSNDKELWETSFRIRTASASQARSLLALFSVARLFIQRGLLNEAAGWGSNLLSQQEAAALLFANMPEQDDDSLTLRINPLDASNIALLFRAFSIYSD